MMGGYTKLFSSLLMSSIWEESAETRLVWVTLLALSDQHGHVDGTVRSLARVSRVSLEACQAALDCLLGPDPNDRSGVMEGRRIVPEAGGWRLVNYAAYRAKMSADERRERDRLRKREQRGSVSAASPQVSENVRDFQQAEAEAEQKQERARATAETPSQPKRTGYADPHGFRRDPSAAAYAIVSEQQQIAIPGQWWERARKDRGLAFDAVDGFASWLAEQVRDGLAVGAKKLQWLDEQLGRYEDSLRPEPVLYPDAAEVMRRHALPAGEELGTLPPGGVQQLIRELKAGRG